jgi:hypothetical protein
LSITTSNRPSVGGKGGATLDSSTKPKSVLVY